MSPEGGKGSNMVLGKRKEIAPKRMKRLDERGYDTQLWTCLVVILKSDAFISVKDIKEQYCIGTWNVRPLNQGKGSNS